MEDTQSTINPAKLFVGNLPYQVRDNDLRELFSQYGTVEDAIVLMERSHQDYDRRPPRSRGMGFVTMSSEEEAKAAVAALHDQDFEGRRIIVAPAKPKTERSDERSGGFRGRQW